MAYVWEEPEMFLEHRGVKVFYTYQDEFADLLSRYWYSLSTAPEADNDEMFDVRDLPGYCGENVGCPGHETVIKQAIDSGVIQALPAE